LQHARAALELNPYEPESNELLAALLARPGAAAAERASGWQSDAPAAAEVAPCSDSWRPPRPPTLTLTLTLTRTLTLTLTLTLTRARSLPRTLARPLGLTSTVRQPCALAALMFFTLSGLGSG